MKIVQLVFILLLMAQIGASQTRYTSLENSPTLTIKEMSSDPVPIMPEWNVRKITGLAYSTFVPGSGQFYLGHKLKGSLITVGFLASFVTAIVSHNNFISNRERLDNLKYEYYSADRYALAEELWKQIKEVHDEQKVNERKRTISSFISAGIWALNIIDYLFFTDDLGVADFSNTLKINDNLISTDLQTIFSIRVPL
ncbi:MAG: hypothetical protein FJ213_00110 [Ignavibacteria bacterium]|nr:hypothetical protein [Ignavibacteria bacterium]